MLLVTLSPLSLSAHVTQPLAGLHDLSAAGAVALRFSTAHDPTCSEQVFTADVARSPADRARRMYFDMRDGRIIERAALERADVYFKRSYDDKELEQFPEALARKVFPYGFHYACSSPHQARTLAFARQLLARELSGVEPGGLRQVRRVLGQPARWLGFRNAGTNASAPLPYTAYEANAGDEADPAVVYLTRLWDPKDGLRHAAPARERLNEGRIALIRTLRARLGERFIGGIERDDYASAQCPDCIADDTAKGQYLAVMKKNLVGVASRGLHRSTGWKIAEYVAAARCIVSDPLPEGAIPGFVPGRNYLPYGTPDEAASACERLLDDPSFAQEMRRQNERYYREELKPPVMMMKHLQRALEAPP